jgi:hypothetical protein
VKLVLFRFPQISHKDPIHKNKIAVAGWCVACQMMIRSVFCSSVDPVPLEHRVNTVSSAENGELENPAVCNQVHRSPCPDMRILWDHRYYNKVSSAALEERADRPVAWGACGFQRCSTSTHRLQVAMPVGNERKTRRVWQAATSWQGFNPDEERWKE